MSSKLVEIAQLTIDLIQPSSKMSIKNIVIGLLYTGVQLANGTVGVSYTLTDRRNDLNAYHQLLQKGFLSEKSLIELIDYCSSKYAILRSVGVAALNSLSQAYIDYSTATDQDVGELLDLTPNSLVGMVGNIHPITQTLIKKNASLRILDEYNPISPSKNTIPASKVSDLGEVDHILISGSALVFDSFDEIINLLPEIPGYKILVGPSAQVLPEVAFQLGFSLVGSSRIINGEKTLHVLQQGGGYRFFKNYTKKYTFVSGFDTNLM